MNSPYAQKVWHLNRWIIPHLLFYSLHLLASSVSQYERSFNGTSRSASVVLSHLKYWTIIALSVLLFIITSVAVPNLRAQSPELLTADQDVGIHLMANRSGQISMAQPANQEVYSPTSQAPVNLVRTFNLNVDFDLISENSGSFTITVTAQINNGQAYASEQILQITVTGSGVSSAVDFTPVPSFNLTVPANAMRGSATFILNPENDLVDEDNETITIASTSSLVTGTDEITLLDDDPSPTGISLNVSPVVAQEDEGAQTFNVVATVTGATTYGSTQVIPISVQGTFVSSAVDFAAIPGFNLTLPAEQTSGSATFILTPEDDLVDETDETITVSSSSSLVLNSAIFLLRDDDSPPGGINLRVLPNVIYEELGTQEVTLTLDIFGATTYATNQVIPITVTGTGDPGVVHFTPVPSFNVTLPAEASSVTTSFFITPTNNPIDQTNETITVASSSPLVTGPTTINLSDDLEPLEVDLTASPSSILESDGPTEVTITATMTPQDVSPTNLIIPLTITGSGNTAAVDYNTSDVEITFTIFQGELSGTASFTVTPINDSEDEINETITVNTPRANTPEIITLVDDDDAPENISLSVDPATIVEGEGPTSVTVTASIGGTTTFGGSRSISIDVSGTGNDGVVGFSSVSNFTITFSPGVRNSSSTLVVTPVDDNVMTDDEVITLSSPDPLVTGSARITLIDNDPDPVVVLLSSDQNSIQENDGPTEITVTATLQNAQTIEDDFTISLNVAGSGREDAVDFTPVNDIILTIIAGTLSGSSTFTLIPEDDMYDESDEVITITSAQESISNSITLRLIDDDETPSIQLTATPSSLRENDGNTDITVTARLIGATRFGGTQILPISVAGSGLTEAVDFIAVEDFSLSIATGNTTGSAMFTLIPENDRLDEIDESIMISSRSPLVTQSATLVLADDDEPGQVQLSVSPRTLFEEGGTQTVTVTGTLSNGVSLSQTRVLPLSVRGSGVSSAVDFEPVPDFNLEFQPATLTATTTFNIVPVDDQEFESDEILTISSTDEMIENPVTIPLVNDDEKPAGVFLSVSPDRIQEDQGSTSVLVTATVQGLTRYATTEVIVLNILDDGDPATVRYLAVDDVEVTIPAGAAQGVIELEIIPENNTTHQPDGIITISSNHNLVISNAMITLENDDDAPSGITLNVSPETVLESGGPTRITITAMVQGETSYAIDQTIGITVSGSGEEVAVDFVSIPDFEITLAAQSFSSTIEIELIPEDDLSDEQNETLTFGSTNPLVTQEGTLVLLDDDLPPQGISISLNPDVIPEDAGETQVMVSVHVIGDTRYATDRLLDLTAMGSGMPDVVGYTLTAPSQLQLPSGQDRAFTTIQILPEDNLFSDRAETITIIARDDQIEASAELSLTDNDADPSGFELTISPDIVNEGDGPTTVNVIASLMGTTRYPTPQSLTLSVSEPSATTVEFQPISDFTILIPAGAESGNASFVLTPTENQVYEEDATITITATHLGVSTEAILLLRDDDLPTQRASDVNAVLSPEATRAIISSTVGAVHHRIQAFSYGLSSRDESISGSLSRIAMRFQNSSLHGSLAPPSIASLLNRASLSAQILQQFSVWAYADYRSLSGNAAELLVDYDGGGAGFHMGTDLSLGRFLVGVAVSRFEGDLDFVYQRSTARPNLTAPVNGVYQVTSLVVSPYLTWVWSSHSKVWFMTTLGAGDVGISDPDLLNEESNTSLGAYAVGADLHLTPIQQDLSLTLKAGIWGGEMNLKENLSRILEQESGVYRTQLSLEAAYRIRTRRQGMIQPFLETGLRGDGGDGQTGTGMDLGGGARLLLPSYGLQLSGHANVLVTHGGNVNEWGFSGILRFAPGGRTGPILELGSSTGEHLNSNQAIWQNTQWHLHAHPRRTAGTRFHSRIGYGLVTKHGSLIPYTGVAFGRGISTRIGADVQLVHGLRIQLESVGMYNPLNQNYSPNLRASLILR